MKQVLEIEVPYGKKAVWKDGRVIFEDVDIMESIKTIKDAVKFLADKRICEDILDSLSRLSKDSFEWKIATYRAVVAACNLVLGIGSYTYQFKSRDSLGFAIKATACKVNGELREIFKHPKTDDGTKNSLKGLIRVEKEDGKYVAYDQQTEEQEKEGCLEPVFVNGELIIDYTLTEIRNNIDSTL